jgi:hypothetical protein
MTAFRVKSQPAFGIDSSRCETKRAIRPNKKTKQTNSRSEEEQQRIEWALIIRQPFGE